MENKPCVIYSAVSGDNGKDIILKDKRCAIYPAVSGNEEKTIISETSCIERECFGDGAWSADSIAQSLSSGCVLLPLKSKEGRLVSYLICRIVCDEAEILRIASRPRGHGYGSEMMGIALKYFREQGVTSVFLEVRASNLVAIKLYERAGFHNICVRRDYYNDPLEDAVMMQLNMTD